MLIGRKSIYLFVLSCFLFSSSLVSAKKNDSSNKSNVTKYEVEICDIAKAIIADSLKYHSSTDHLFSDIEIDYSNPMLLPFLFYVNNEPYNFEVSYMSNKNKSSYTIDEETIFCEDIEISKMRSKAFSKAFALHPQSISYDWNSLPKPPKEEIINYEINKDAIRLVGTEIQLGSIGIGLPNADRWKIYMNSSVQFTQNYVSDNWYQGGESNINILSLQKMIIKHFDPSKKVEFETVINVNTGFYTTESDTMRMFRVNDNLLQIDSKLGLRAISNWYYTTAVLFKTQVFNNYAANTDQLKSQFLSPAEMNLSVGMEYNKKNKKGNLEFSLLFAPIAYNLKYVANIKEVREQDFGIKEGHHTDNQIGSTFRGRMNWKITNNVSWSSNLNYFTNYERSQGDFENVFNFSINKFFTTRLAVHVRYDDSRGPEVEDFQYKIGRAHV